MKTILPALLAALLTILPCSAAPVPLIFDTDMDSDCDDAGALAILHALADRGEVTILATVVSSLYRWNVPCVEAINRYYGRAGLPIGAPKRDAVDSHCGSNYARQIAESAPTRWKSNADAPDAVSVYRETLAKQPDGAVVIISVGDLTNLRNLLRSAADEHSPLAGPDLVRRKVKRWVCMGGGYPNDLDPKVCGNLKTDPAATVEAARDWPTEVVFSGSGEHVLTGSRLKETPPKNPVRRAFELFLGNAPARPSWDEIVVLFSVRPGAPFWKLRTDGYNHIFPNGTNEWRADPDSPRHVLLELAQGAEAELQRVIDELMVAPPLALMLSTSELDEEVAQAIEAGAVGFILKTEGQDVLVAAIRAVARGERRFSPGVLRRLDERQKLSRRELQVLEAMSSGLCNKEIATRLTISEHTVKTYVKTILDKLGALDRMGAVSQGFSRGLLKVS